MSDPRRARRGTLVWLVALAALAAPASGCTIWNAPDRGLLDGGRPDAPIPDGGPDAPDAPIDAGVDAPDAFDGGVDAGPPPFEGNCVNSIDDDGDGYVDCADIDCASDFMACCTAGALALDEQWTSAGFTGWSRLPSGSLDGPRPPVGNVLSSFTLVGSPNARGLIRDPAGAATGCIPIDPGVTITTSLQLLPDTVASCTACTERAGILLTAVQPATAVASYGDGDSLPDELGVRLRPTGAATGSVEVTIAGSVVASLDDVAVGETVAATITLWPGLAEDGTPVSFATIDLVGAGAHMLRALDREPALLRSTLLGPASGCDEGRGLYLAVEGVGNRVAIGRTQVAPQVCPNPNHFLPFAAPSLEAADLGAQPAWSSGGVGAPSLFYVDEDPGAAVSPRWDLLFDASDRNRANETFANIPFAVGGAIFFDDAWTALSARRGGAPLVDEAFPTCAMGCTGSNRDPDLWSETNAERELSGLTSVVVWSRRTDAGVWEIRGDFLSFAFDSRMGIGSDRELLSTASAPITGMCTALRSPSLVERPGGFWLFFVCEHGGSPADVRAVSLSATAMVDGAPVVVLTSMMAPYASLGIQDVDAETWIRNPGTADQEVLLRLWFVSRSGGLPVVGIAEGIRRGMSADPPDVEMFPGNPVLYSDDERLPACVGLCRLTSVSVARVYDPRDVVVVVARSDESTAVTTHALVPLRQRLPARR